MSTKSYRSLVAGVITTTIIALRGYAAASPLRTELSSWRWFGASAPMLAQRARWKTGRPAGSLRAAHAKH